VTTRSRVFLWVGIAAAALLLVVMLGLIRNDATSNTLGALMSDGFGMLQAFALMLLGVLTGVEFGR
jgi:hypothetical protein